MKRISLFLLLSIFLASCADAATPIQIPTLTATKEATATSTPTNTPEPTPTPTPRPDDAPTDADAVYNEKDNTWHKTVETWFGKADAVWVPASEVGENLKGWYVNHGSFPAIWSGIHNKQHSFGFNKNYIPIKLELPMEMEGPKIKYTYDDNGTESSVGMSVYSVLTDRYAAQGNSRDDFYYHLTDEENPTDKTKITVISIPFISTDGIKREFKPSSTTGVIVRWVDLDTALDDPRFLKTSVSDRNTKIYVFTTGDEYGNIISYIASNIAITDMTEQEVAQSMFFSLITVSLGENQTVRENHETSDASVYNHMLGEIGQTLRRYGIQSTNKDNQFIVDLDYPPVQSTP